MRYRLSLSALVLCAFFAAGENVAVAQSASLPAPVTFTADQDHQNMMDQLGIKALRPGPSGNEKAPTTPTTTSRKPIHFPTCPTR